MLPVGAVHGNFARKDLMHATMNRRSVLAPGPSMEAPGALPSAFAQGKPKLRFRCAFNAQDLRAGMTPAYRFRDADHTKKAFE